VLNLKRLSTDFYVYLRKAFEGSLEHVSARIAFREPQLFIESKYPFSKVFEGF
jgi:hypothetical protein